MEFGIFTVGDVTTDPTTGRAPTESERIKATVAIAQKAEEVGLDVVVVLDRPHLPRPSDAGLDLVVDVEDPVLAAQLGQPGRVVGRHLDEPALALDGLEQHARDRRRVDLRLEDLLQAGERVVALWRD